MAKFTSPLDEVRVAAPCPADWGKMVGDERVRYCDRCSLHVYNLSGMSRREAEALVTNAEGRLCVRFYRRADGTILTRNCPVGLSALRRRAARVAGSVLSAALGFFAGLGLDFGLGRPAPRHVMGAMAAPAARSYSPSGGDSTEAPAPATPAFTGVMAAPLPNVTEVRGRLARVPKGARSDAIVAYGTAHGRRQR
ncbi:MAG TPA: hypothetical protein VF659_19515 [Pyrinomonadaceae bacterium]|jgi:hypothetical protein